MYLHLTNIAILLLELDGQNIITQQHTNLDMFMYKPKYK